MFTLIYKHLILGFLIFLVAAFGLGFIIWQFLTVTEPFIGSFLYTILMFVCLGIWVWPFGWLQTKVQKNMLKKTEHIREATKYIHHYNINKEPVYYYKSDGGFGTLTLITLLGGMTGICLYFVVAKFAGWIQPFIQEIK